MARPYESPQSRRRMMPGAMENSAAPDSDAGMEGEVEAPASDKRGESEAGESKEAPSAFVPKAALMGREYKAGQAITMTVKSVDPETGELEVICSPESKSSRGSVEGIDELGED